MFKSTSDMRKTPTQQGVEIMQILATHSSVACILANKKIPD